MQFQLAREVSSDHLKIPSKLRGSITGARIAADFRSSPALLPTSACSKSRDVSPKFVRRPQDDGLLMGDFGIGAAVRRKEDFRFGASVVAVVGELEARDVAQHVGMTAARRPKLIKRLQPR
jgi:hypothetical protein